MATRNKDPKDEAMRRELKRQQQERKAAALDAEADGDEDMYEDIEVPGMFRKGGRGMPHFAYDRDFGDLLDNAVFDDPQPTEEMKVN